MAEFSIHIVQAEHNKSLVKYLLNGPYYDWAITACFYSAIHYFEARLFLLFSNRADKHSDTSIPLDNLGNLKYSNHTWREILIQKHLRNVYRSYRKLKENSETARYLTLSSGAHIQPSYNYFQVQDAKNSLKILESLEEGLNIELAKFLYELNMDKSDQMKAFWLINKVLQNFSSEKDILDKSKLKKFLSNTEITFLENHLASKGHKIK